MLESYHVWLHVDQDTNIWFTNKIFVSKIILLEISP